MTPLFAFSSTVNLASASFTEWNLQTLKYYEGCSSKNMLFSFPGFSTSSA